MRYSNEEVNAQKERFDNLLKKANLVKAGEKISYFMRNESGSYNYHNFVRKFLSINKIQSSMYYPSHKFGRDTFYGDLFRYEALNALIDSKDDKKVE